MRFLWVLSAVLILALVGCSPDAQTRGETEGTYGFSFDLAGQTHVQLARVVVNEEENSSIDPSV